jgi:transposase
MAQRRTLNLSEEQEKELSQLRDQTNQEYVRERCAALLKIAAGRSARWVALHGLLRARDPDTVYHWLNIYEAEGIGGLQAHQQGGNQREYL